MSIAGFISDPDRLAYISPTGAENYIDYLPMGAERYIGYPRALRDTSATHGR